ncbi:MAG: hypothetical protein NZ898_13720 [Myxococcota bacterium]|nr:hypothetical protein [Myxococcota bacterium]
MKREEPPRLVDDPEAPEGLRADLRAVRDIDPPSFDLERGVQRLRAHLDGAAVPSGMAGLKATVAGIAIAVAVGLGVSWFWPAREAHAPASETSGGTVRSKSEPTRPPHTEVSPGRLETAPALAGSGLIGASPVGDAPPPAPGVDEARPASPRAVGEAPRRANGREAGVAGAERAGRRSRGPSVEREIAGVAAARAALHVGRPADALAELDALDREVGPGLLDEERLALRVLALAESGRGEQARALARRYFASFPQGAHAERIAQELGLERPPTHEGGTTPGGVR